MRGTRLRWEAHRGAGPGWRQGPLGNMCVPWTYTEQSCRPRTRWEVGRGVIDRVGRGHVRNGLSGAGSHRWAWSRMRADLHVRRSPWWPEAMPYPLPPAPGQDPGLVLGRVLFGAWMKVECSVGGERMLQASLIALWGQVPRPASEQLRLHHRALIYSDFGSCVQNIAPLTVLVSFP